MPLSPLRPDFAFLDAVEAAGPFNLSACFACRKCTNGCPASFAMDLYPDQVIRLALLGRSDELLRCRTIWVCASCETCSTRCPKGVRIAELMDCLKEMAVRRGAASPEPRVTALHQSFLENVAQTGRVFEGALLPVYMLRSGQAGKKIENGSFLDEMRMGLKLLRKRRLSLLPHVIEGRDEVNAIISGSPSAQESPQS